MHGRACKESKRFDENPFTCQREKEDEKGLRISNFAFWGGVVFMAVKGLNV